VIAPRPGLWAPAEAGPALADRSPTPEEGEAVREGGWAGEHPGWGIRDILMVLTVVSLAYSIVEIPPIAIAPAVYIPIAFLGASLRSMESHGRRLVLSPTFLWIAVTMIGVVGVRALYTPSSFEVIADAGRTIGYLAALLALALYCAASRTLYHRLLATILVVLGVSILWFLCELLFVNPFVRWRLALYADFYRTAPRYLTLERMRSGLVPYLHLLGYQIAAFVPLALVPLLDPVRNRRALVPAAATLLAALLAMVISSQRSALAAILCGAGITLLYARGGRAAVKVGLVALVVIFGADTVLKRDDVWAGNTLPIANIFEKLASVQASRDAQFRIRLQVRAVELIAKYPLGLRVEGRSWGQEGFMHVHSRMEQAPRYNTGEIAVHNGYLGIPLEFGLPFLFATLLFLRALWKTGRRLIVEREMFSERLRLWIVAVVGTTAGLFAFQVTTHNASFLTLEPVSVLMLALVMGADLLLPPVAPKEEQLNPRERALLRRPQGA
jgi:hypothetical protein